MVEGVLDSGRVVRLLQRNGRFHAVVEGLTVHSSGASAEEALAALEVRWAELAAFADDTNLPLTTLAPLCPAPPAVGERPWWRSLRTAALVVVCFGLMMLPLSYALSTALTRTAANLKLEGGAEFWRNVEDGLYRAADSANEIPAAKREKITAALRALVSRYKPYVDELRPLLSGTEPVLTPLPALQAVAPVAAPLPPATPATPPGTDQ